MTGREMTRRGRAGLETLGLWDECGCAVLRGLVLPLKTSAEIAEGGRAQRVVNWIFGGGVGLARAWGNGNAEKGYSYDWSEFLEKIAEQIAQGLIANSQIKHFVTNPDVIGAYAEASVRELIRNIVSPVRVCTGAVIDPELCEDPRTVPQIDTIIWSPSPAPAIFNAGDFGLVPRSSAFGLLEIKRSCYQGVGTALEHSLNRAPDLVADIARYHATETVGTSEYWPVALGVICLREHSQRDATVEALEHEGRVVTLISADSDGTYTPKADGILKLLNFLIQRRKLAKDTDGSSLVNVTLLQRTHHT